MNLSEKGQKILIVDDNKQNIALLMDIFKDNYKISAAINAERALKIARSESPPDIILLDILMPEMDGYQVCAILKEDERTKNIPIIFVTAVSEVMDAAKGFELGAVDYITKPFHPPVVKARVQIHLSLKHQQELLEKYAFLDALTEIANRRRFDQVAQKEWNRAMRSGRPLAVLMMDIDHFKEFNDTYGHGSGDDCLKKVARAIGDSLRRAGDFAARYGGEEFAALLPYTEADEALEIAEKIRKAVEKLNVGHTSSPMADHVTVSIGVAIVRPEESPDMARMIQKADQALYKAKQSGRNLVAC